MNIIKRIGIGIASIVAIAISIKIFGIFQTGPEKVCDIVAHWFIAWGKGGVIAAVVIAVVFAINRYIASKQTMSICGILILAPLLTLLLVGMFGYGTGMVTLGILVGGIIGYFSYIIDDGALEIWENRLTVFPLLVGLGFGGSVIIACLVEKWQAEDIYVADHATCVELIIERYTHHESHDDDGKDNSYETWEEIDTKYFMERGHQFKDPQEGVDYSLGYGYNFTRDRIRTKYHEWVGAIAETKYSAPKPFRWIYLTTSGLQYPEGKSFHVEENFFAQIMENGTPIETGLDTSGITPTAPLPTSAEVPGVFTMTFWFVEILCTHPDFGLLRWIYLLAYLPLFILVLFIPALRPSFAIFFVSSTIIIVLILAGAAARSGKKFSEMFEGFGGGSFGGGGSSGRF